MSNHKRKRAVQTPEDVRAMIQWVAVQPFGSTERRFRRGAAIRAASRIGYELSAWERRVLKLGDNE